MAVTPTTRSRLITAAVATTTAIAGLVAGSTVSVPSTTLQPGQSIAVKCPSGGVTYGRNVAKTQVAVRCPLPSASASPSTSASPSALPSATTAPTPTPTAAPTATVAPTPTPAPTPTVTVNSIAALYSALDNNANTSITLSPGSYSGGIYFDSRFAGRTNPAIVHLTGVTLNGGGLTFRGGAHDIEVDDATFANWNLNQTGVLMFCGWAEPGAYRITVRRATVLTSVHRTLEANTSEHGAYFSHSQNGCHDILIEDFTVNATDAMGLATGIHADHADGGLVNSYNVTVHNLTFHGNGAQGSSVQDGIILWTVPLHDWTFDGASITNSNGNAIRYEAQGTNMVFKNIVSTGTRYQPFYSSTQGANPPGVIFGPGNSFH